jgi:hypothetical protein
VQQGLLLCNYHTSLRFRSESKRPHITYLYSSRRCLDGRRRVQAAATSCARPEVRLHLMHAQHPNVTLLSENLAYLEKREAGWPIGSGMVESVNTLLVEARLTGAGRHWKRRHVNPMLVLRNAVCNQRGPETWRNGLTHRLSTHQLRRQQRADRRVRLAWDSLLVELTRLPPLANPTPANRPPTYSWKRPFLRRPLPPSICVQKCSAHLHASRGYPTCGILERCCVTHAALCVPSLRRRSWSVVFRS